MRTYQRPRFGTVGRPVTGVEVRIAEDGEIQLKGRNMTRGYLHMPEETAELLTEDGWLCTGDLGEQETDGSLKITGRKKDLLITAGGKNVAPAETEAHLQQIMGIGQAVVVGDRQPYLCALLTLDPESVTELCAKLGVTNGAIEALAKEGKVRDYLTSQIESECNSKVARYQSIKKFEILEQEFSVEGGELTPTMKVKRNVVHEKYKDVIERFYA